MNLLCTYYIELGSIGTTTQNEKITTLIPSNDPFVTFTCLIHSYFLKTYIKF